MSARRFPSECAGRRQSIPEPAGPGNRRARLTGAGYIPGHEDRPAPLPAGGTGGKDEIPDAQPAPARGKISPARAAAFAKGTMAGNKRPSSARRKQTRHPPRDSAIAPPASANRAPSLDCRCCPPRFAFALRSCAMLPSSELLRSEVHSQRTQHTPRRFHRLSDSCAQTTPARAKIGTGQIPSPANLDT